MIVANILSKKGNAVVTTPVGSDMKKIAKLLGDNGIGAVVVLDGDSVCGIVSERDVVREIARKGHDALEMPVKDCMTSNVVSCDQHATIDEVMGKMTEGRFRHIPIVEDGKLIGIVSIGDVVKRKIELAEQEAEDMKKYIAG